MSDPAVRDLSVSNAMAPSDGTVIFRSPADPRGQALQPFRPRPDRMMGVKDAQSRRDQLYVIDAAVKRDNLINAARAKRRASYALRLVGIGRSGALKDLARQERLRRSPGGR